MAQPSPTYVVKMGARSPGRRAAAAAVVLLAAGALYSLGHYVGLRDGGRAAHDYGPLREQVADLQRENQSLRARAAMLQQGSKIDQYAYRDVSKSLKGLQDEIYELKEEVAFYRTILEPAQSGKGLRVQSLRLAREGGTDQYRYRLVLTQVITEVNSVSGDVEMTVYGDRNGAPAQLSLKDLTGGADARLHFGFKYFQKLQGEVALPDGFTPERVVLRVIPRGKAAQAVERTFQWKEVKA